MDVRPPMVEVSAKPGEESASVFVLTNTESVAQTYAFTIQGFVAQGDEGRQLFLPPSETDGLPSWLFLRQPRLTLKAGESVSVPIFFRPPQEAGPGAYQAVVFSSAVDVGQREGVALGSRVGVLVFATVEGDVRRSLDILAFRHISSSFSLRFKPEFELLLANRGGAHEVPQGRVLIQNVFGHVVEALPIQSAQQRAVRILPASERRFVLRADPLKRAFSGWGLGVYRAQVVLDQPFEARAHAGWFFVLPWKTLLVVFVLSVGGIFLRRRRP